MNIERGPRKERGFVIIDNALAQDHQLSFGARGLGTYLLSLPPGKKVDIRSLAEDNPEGRQAIAGYMNELEAAFYLVRTRAQGAKGQFVTTCTMHEEPQDPASLPVSLPKPWSKAKTGDAPQLEAVPDLVPVGEFSQVGPNPGNPNFGQPNFGEPGPGQPGPGITGANPYGVKEPGERTSSSAREAEDPPTAGLGDSEGGGGDAPQQQEQDPLAIAFVDGLPYRGRIPGPKQRAHLIGRVMAAFASGWTEYALKKQLTADTDNAKSMSAVYRYRLDPENLPAVSEPATTVPAQHVIPLQNCPDCDRAFRSPEPGRCRGCKTEPAYA